jgi:hypothetical protein
MSLKKFDANTYEFGGHPVRITLHWTGGSYTPSSLDAEHYQFLIDGDGDVWCGKYTIEDQDSTASNYAAHTARFNTKNIGVALCGMAGAQENGTFGQYPLNERQFHAMVSLCALLCNQYGLVVAKETLASHCEIQEIHGVAQFGKWDISAVTFTNKTWTALNDMIRDAVQDQKDESGINAPSTDKTIYISVPAGVDVEVKTR